MPAQHSSTDISQVEEEAKGYLVSSSAELIIPYHGEVWQSEL